MCDTVTVIEKGKILATGTVQDILEGVRRRRILSVRLAGPTDGLERFLLEQPGVANVHEAGGRVQFEFDGGDDEQVALVGRLIAAGFPVLEFSAAQRRPRGSVHRDHRRAGAMSTAHALLGWLESRSDWLSPLVVKEVRQVVRGREFTLLVRRSACWPGWRSRSSARPMRSPAAARRAGGRSPR